MSNDLKLSEFQKKVCAIPEAYDLFLGGGRGGAKSYTLAILALRHIEQYGSDSRILFIRKSYRGIRYFEAICREIFGRVYGVNFSYNQTDNIFTLPSGAFFELGQLSSPAHYQKYQGRSFNLLLCDEAGQYSSPQFLDKLRSNLRGPTGLPVRMVLAANPGGPGHQWIAKRFVFKDAKGWEPFFEENSERTFVSCPSTYKMNPFIDQDAYKKQLKASLPTDEELLKAWLNGDWSVARGAYFSTVLSEKRNAIDPLPGMPLQSGGFEPARPGISSRKPWEHWLAFDYGSSAPSVCYIMARSPGIEIRDQYFPKDSIVCVDELAFYDPNDLNKGLEYTIPHQAELIKEFCASWGVAPRGAGDDSMFSKHGHSAGSIAQEFSREGVHFRRAKKGDRKSGWEQMRTLMQNAGKPDKPGLYVSRSCDYFWQTVPYIGRDSRDPEDLDTTGADHACDACRYGLGYRKIELSAGMINW